MKKFRLIFLVICILPLYISAQQSILPKLSQPAPKSPPPVKKAVLPSESKELLNNESSAVHKTAGSALSRRKKKVGATLYGNEWINYSQFYYKIKIGRNGIYRIDSATLAKAGIPVNTVDSRKYQIFFRGQQQYIYIKSRTTYLNETNGDYIEFYGEGNDGTLDSTIYYNIKFLPNPYYSLFTDSSTYYLTWDALTTNYRMTEQTDTAFGSYGATANYFITPTINLQNGTYFPGAWLANGAFTPNDPRFTQNTAWTGGWIYYNSGEILYPDVSNVYTGTGAPPAFMRTVVLGVDNGYCTFTVSSNVRALWSNVPCNGFAAFNLDITFSASDVANGGFYIKYYNNAISNTNIIAPTYIYLSYPHTLNLGGDSTLRMFVPDDTAATKSYLFMTDIYTNAPSDSVRMYDLTNHNRFWVKQEGGGFKVIIPNSGELKQCYLASDYVINKVSSLTPVGINRNGRFTDFSTAPANTFLIITHPTLWPAAQSYATYRASRGFVPVVADVEELYDQFGYGVYYSPLGIRSFCNYAINNWDSPPSYLFLIGKGIHTPIFRPDTAKWTRTQLLVPSFGYPSSDILFTNELNGGGYLEPAIPTGRLAAQTPADVSTYLSKVETFESAPAALWMKSVAHFAGGNNISEESGFLQDLNGYAAIISDTLFGGKVFTFQKTSTTPISGTLTDSIINRIDSGVSIMTFFGHASGSSWDESVDYPNQYSNTGKYPFMIADACFSGDIFQPEGAAVTSISEQWVLEPPGAIGFLASDYLGDPAELDNYTTTLYQDISYRPFYRKSIGSIIQNTVATWQTSPDIFETYTCLEMTLHGDPAIAINAMDSLPDYAVNNQSIYFTPANVNVLQDSFNVNLIVYNYAEALYQPVSGILNRTLPNGVQQPYSFTFPHIFYQDTVSIRMPVNPSIGMGLNTFTYSVNLDPTVWKELTYANNSITNPGVPLDITSEDITPVWPYDYAIIPKDTITLKASTDDPFAPQRTYIFEMDTSHNFNSKLFRSDTVTQSGGVVKVTPYDWIFPADTIHFNGLEKRKIPNSMGKIALKESENTENSPAMKNAMGVKSNTVQNKFNLSKPLPEQMNTSSANKQSAINGETSLTQSKGAAGSKNNLFSAKSFYVRRPVRDSFTNGAVYYWRVRRDTADLTKYPWALSSFQYIKNQNGWGQSNFFQFDNDELFNDYNDFINYNTTPRNWTFNMYGHTLQCFSFGMINLNITNLYATEYEIDNNVVAYAGCQINWGIYVAVINPTTLTPWNTRNYDFGNINDSVGSRAEDCLYPDNKFIFWDNSSAQTTSLIKMLNSIPNGYYILAYTWVEGEFKAPGLTNDSLVVATFEKLGATQMPYHRTTPGLDSVPWIFFVQKGNPSSVIQVYGRDDTSAISISTVLKNNGTYGVISTPLIGPAAKYDSLSWLQHSVDNPNTDSTRLNIIGMQSDGNMKTLITGITPAVANMYISSINPVQFPEIQLQLYTKDAINRTPGQMNYWRVFYQPVPEVAMNPNIYTYFSADTLPYGDTLRFQTVVQNISDWAIDSTLLLTWTTNQSNSITYLNPNKFVKPLKAGDTAKISMWMADNPVNVSTLKSVWFEVNPEAYPQTRPEQYHFNNYASKNFYSYGDKINPLLDVTFNGIHIMNNDIVSAKPNILITFMDENKYLALNNPNNFQIYLRNITSPTPVLQTLGSTLSFTPAILPNNKCSFLFTPALADGTYELTVQGTDISGNPSANNSYTIDFEVINKSMISQVLNYPNPFSTSTRFVFILTGDEIPTVFKIQIMTVTGKIVREINEDEIGPIHVGTNITQYAWDGTDKYGNKLANGVYLYHVVASINGQNIDGYQTSADQYFTKGWGKMFLMR